MNIYQALKSLYPNADFSQIVLQDDSDGNGPYIKQWNIDSPQPTPQIIQAEIERLLSPDETCKREFAESVSSIKSAIQTELDRCAKLKDYDDIKSAALRAGYQGPFHDEGVAFAIWMDACWSCWDAVLRGVYSGQRTMPTPAEAVAMLPTLELP